MCMVRTGLDSQKQGSLCLGPPEVFILSSYWASGSCRLQFRFAYPRLAAAGVWCAVLFACVKIHLPL